MNTTQNTAKKTLAPEHMLAAFFSANHHDFRETKQAAWIEFASNTSQQMVNIFSIKNIDITLIEALEILAHERQRFAQEQPDIAQEKKKQFGRWRDAAYSLSTQQAATVLERRHELNQLLQASGHPAIAIGINASISQTCYTKEHPFFHHIKANLQYSETKDSKHLDIEPTVDANHKEFVNALVKKKYTISPDSFFDTVSYKQYSISDPKMKTDALTRFIMIGGDTPTFFVAIEHPLPNIVHSLLKTDIEDLFQSLLQARNNRHEFIEKLAEFLWYGYQLMPFERGSASIFLILTAALLQSANITLKPYPENRMDIDAISLTQALFTQKFITVYA